MQIRRSSTFLLKDGAPFRSRGRLSACQTTEAQPTVLSSVPPASAPVDGEDRFIVSNPVTAALR